MSYTIEKGGDIVISGFEKGIADSPYEGIADMRNINIIPIPKEGSVNFSTSAITQQGSSGNLTSADPALDTVLLTGATFDSGAAITFAGGGLPAGIVAGTTYWAVLLSGGTYQLYTDYPRASLLDITGTGSGTWATVNMTTPKYFAYDSGFGTYWMLDSAGRVWSNTVATNNNPFYWTYTGNRINSRSNGNGLVYYRASDGTGYMFVFSNSSIDYTPTASANVAWVYQWNVAAGTTGSWSNTPTQRLKTPVTVNNPHEAMVAPDNKVYFTDANYVGRWYQADPAVPFDPTNITTYIFDQTQLLPFTDTAQCLAPLGNNMLVGAKGNIIYPWDTFSSLPSFPIFVAESSIVKMVTVNTNTFIFVGGRGRIYVTNGSQASLYKKIPDSISGTVEPYYTWGGATSNKNQLYFGALVTTNSGASISQYGGVWAIDLDTKAIRLTNKLSYGTYAGYASAIIPIFSTQPAGTGLYIGWNSGASTFGIDQTISTPYTGGEATIDSDLIPIGTFLKPTTNGRLEFKLIVPIVNGESVKLQYRQAFSDAFADISSTTVFNFAGIATNAWNGYSGAYQNVDFQNSQWIQIRAVLTSTASSPSYCRLVEMRIGQ